MRLTSFGHRSIRAIQQTTFVSTRKNCYTCSSMSRKEKPIRALYSFPHKLGADRICYTAWQQLKGLSKAGVEVLAIVGVLQRGAPPDVSVKTTLAYGKIRLPYKVLGRIRPFALHDWLVARQLDALKDKIDIIHTWP